MARIDVSEILTDPDFLDDVLLIRRTAALVGARNVVTEADPVLTAMVVQDGVQSEDIQRVPEALRLLDSITVWSVTPLTAQDRVTEGGYSDVLGWDDRRWEVRTVLANFTNWGQGYTKALATLMQPHA